MTFTLVVIAFPIEQAKTDQWNNLKQTTASATLTDSSHRTAVHCPEHRAVFPRTADCFVAHYHWKLEVNKSIRAVDWPNGLNEEHYGFWISMENPVRLWWVVADFQFTTKQTAKWTELSWLNLVADRLEGWALHQRAAPMIEEGFEVKKGSSRAEIRLRDDLKTYFNGLWENTNRRPWNQKTEKNEKTVNNSRWSNIILWYYW
jgi:hypothetical protein